jgi:hypothetical protein
MIKILNNGTCRKKLGIKKSKINKNIEKGILPCKKTTTQAYASLTKSV